MNTEDNEYYERLKREILLFMLNNSPKSTNEMTTILHVLAEAIETVVHTTCQFNAKTDSKQKEEMYYEMLTQMGKFLVSLKEPKFG